MPELPEVEGVARALTGGSPSILGSAIQGIVTRDRTVVAGCTSEELSRVLIGRKFVSLIRHGKYLLFRLECISHSLEESFPMYLVIHLRMTGRLYLVPAVEFSARYTRISFLLDSQHALRFDDPRKFGKVRIVLDLREILDSLGPDALGIGYDLFANRLSRYRRQLKPLLLDQSFVAGIGNIYADEILFRSCLHPLKNSGDLTEVEVVRLHQAVVSVLEEAVRQNGANIDGAFEAGLFQVKVYGRGGQTCQVCGDAIVRRTIGQRGCWYCPSCQS